MYNAHRLARIVGTIVLILLTSTVVGCAASHNPLTGEAGGAEGAAGFLLGLWHGFIALFTFIISLFSDNVGVYEVHNNGGWYNFGFILGVMMFFGGGGGGASKSRCRGR